MKTRQSEDNGNAGTTHQRRVPVLSILVTLDAFVLGGLVALLMVNRFLNDHLAYYAQSDLWAEASAILDLLDNLLIYFVGYIGVLLVLLLITAVAWVWSKTLSRLLRYGVVLLVVSIVLVIGIVWMGRIATTTPPPPPMTPTPVAMAGETTIPDVLFHPSSPHWRPA